MNVRTAVRLRLPFGTGFRQAADAALRAADSGAPAAVRALARALRSRRHEVVWRAWLDLPGESARRWASPLVTELLGARPPIPDLLVDAAWADWLRDHDDRLWALLRDWGGAASGLNDRERSLSRLALGDDDGPDPRLLAETAARFDHPIGEHARAHLLRHADQESVDLLCAAAMDAPEVAAFCVIGDLAPSGAVVDAAWRAWLEEGDGTRWSLLRHWNRPATSDPRRNSLSRLALGDDGSPVDASVLAEAAARFDHPIGERARARLAESGDAVELFCAAAPGSPEAVAFCVAHRLAPADDVQRAVFFLRTDQHEQYRALDADGALLALGYRSASSRVRESLRVAMTALGGIDALRVLAGRNQRDDLASLTEAERAYLVRQLTDRGDWGRLWSLAGALPLAEAVAAVRAFGDWRPGDEDDRRVFEALRAADPHAVRALGQALHHVRIGLGDLDERLSERTVLTDLDVSPDGAQVAFAATRDTEVGEVGCAGFVDLGGETVAGLYYHFAHPLDRVAHLGSDTFAVVESRPDRPGRKAEIRCAGRDEVRAPYALMARIRGLERVAGDRAFVVCADDALLTGSFGGPLAATGMSERAHLTVVAPGSRLVGVLGATGAQVTDLAGSVVHRLGGGPAGTRPMLAALSPSALVSCDRQGLLRVWHEPFTSAGPPKLVPMWSPATSPIGLAWSPALNRFLAVHDSHVELLDVTRPAPGERIALAAPAGGPPARLSPAGDLLAVKAGDQAIDVYTLTSLILARLIARPLGQLNHGVLADVAAARASPAFDEESRETLDLLRVCLEHRFRHDVGIGAGRAHAADDVALGGS